MVAVGGGWERYKETKPHHLPLHPEGDISHYIILNNAIIKSNSSIFTRSEGYITQYTP